MSDVYCSRCDNNLLRGNAKKKSASHSLLFIHNAGGLLSLPFRLRAFPTDLRRHFL